MYRIALFNVDCFSSARSIQEIIIKHHDQIKLVVLSDPVKTKRGNLFYQTYVNFKASGLRFVCYLFLNFVVHPKMTKISHWLGRIVKKHPTYYSIDYLCKKYDIQCIKTGNINSTEVEEMLKKLSIDLITIYYFDQIIKENIISIPKYGVINFHPAWLPYCRGLHPVMYSIIKNNAKFGMTAHEITDERIDAGDILHQKEINITDTDQKYIFKVEDDVICQGVEVYDDVISNLESFKEKSKKQTEGSYFSHPSRADVKDLLNKGYQIISPVGFWRLYRLRKSSVLPPGGQYQEDSNCTPKS